jgi:surface antigen
MSETRIIWPIAPGNCDGANREQFAQREMQADPEHQQDDAEFRQLARDRLVRDIAWRKRANNDAGDQVPSERGKPQTIGQRSENE